MDTNVELYGVENSRLPGASPVGFPEKLETIPELPYYLKQDYYWIYVKPSSVKLLDREIIVSIILWGQHLRLQRAAFSEIKPGQRVLQPASVYGNFCPNLAKHVGPQGKLDILDIAPVQVSGCRRKLKDLPQASIRLADARYPGTELYDVVCCYFLMHELPEDYKCQVMDAMLARLAPGGKLVLVDFHKPHWAHPIKPVTSVVFDLMEPFAKSLWRHPLCDFATDADQYDWHKETYFGGLYQKVTVQKSKQKSKGA